MTPYGIIIEKLSRSRALQLAMQKMKNATRAQVRDSVTYTFLRHQGITINADIIRHPFFWCGFVTYGSDACITGTLTDDQIELIKRGFTNDAESCYQLGRAFEEGKGWQYSEELSFYWYEKAAKLGHLEAIIAYAELILNDLDRFSRNMIATEAFIDYGISQNHPKAHYLKYLFFVRNRQQDKAEDMLASAIDQGEEGAIFLHACHLAKQGNLQDAAEIIEALGATNPTLFCSYARELQDIGADTKETVDWFQKARENGVYDANYYLAEMLLEDEQNTEQLKIYLQEGYDQGNVLCRYLLSYVAYRSDEIDIQAYGWEMLCLAENGFVGAMYTVGILIFTGEFNTEALDAGNTYWLERAASEGDEEAKMILARFYCLGNASEFVYQKGLRYLHELTASGYSLDECYRLRLQIGKDAVGQNDSSFAESEENRKIHILQERLRKLCAVFEEAMDDE